MGILARRSRQKSKSMWFASNCDPSPIIGYLRSEGEKGTISKPTVEALSAYLLAYALFECRILPRTERMVERMVSRTEKSMGRLLRLAL